MAEWFIHLHNVLHWWGPVVLALYTAVIPWVLYYPWRHYEVIHFNRFSFSQESELISLHVGIFLFALVGYYVLWFALPHKGIEILLMILVSPFAGIYFIYTVFAWLLEAFLAIQSYEAEKRRKLGMSYAEWEIFKFQQEERKREAEHRAFEEREAMLGRGEDIRKERFRVLDGHGEGDDEK